MSEDKPRIGYLGVGLMGGPMVERLLQAGFEVTVWNRTRAKLAPFVEAGAREAATPADLIRCLLFRGLFVILLFLLRLLSFLLYGLPAPEYPRRSGLGLRKRSALKYREHLPRSEHYHARDIRIRASDLDIALYTYDLGKGLPAPLADIEIDNRPARRGHRGAGVDLKRGFSHNGAHLAVKKVEHRSAASLFAVDEL